MINIPCLNCDNNATSKKFMEIVNSTVLALHVGTQMSLK